MSDIFSNREDWVKSYSNRRKSMPIKDIEDLIECTLGYLKQTTKDKKTYAVRLGDLGFMYKKFKPEKEKNQNLKYQNSHDLIDQMILEVAMNNDNRRNPLITTHFIDREYKGLSLEEIQSIQNATED